MKFVLGTRVFGSLLLLLSMASAHATVISFDLDTEFSGATPPGGTAPWVTATFDDGNTPGSVTLTLDLFGLVGAEYLQSFYFNIDVDPTFVSLSNEDTTDTSYSLFGSGFDAFQPDGDGLFDHIFVFSDSDFTAGEVWSIDLNLPGIFADNFNVLSTPAGGVAPNGLYVAARIEGIGPQAADGGWITASDGQIPEPTTLALMGLGLAGVGFSRRKTR